MTSIKLYKQTGFTMVELITVIVVLGVLAAMALPRFTDIQREARISKLKALQGAMRSASTIIHAKWLAQPAALSSYLGNYDPSGWGLLDIGDTTGVVLANGYPAAMAGGINYAVGSNDRFTSLSGFTMSAGGWSVGQFQTWQSADAPDPANCGFTYTTSAAPNVPPVLSPLAISGC